MRVATGALAPHEVVDATRARAPAGTIASIDAGAHMLVAMPLWEVDERDQALISSGLATMGFALPAAISAAIARPDRRVVCFVGDGGLGMTVAELETRLASRTLDRGRRLQRQRAQPDPDQAGARRARGRRSRALSRHGVRRDRACLSAFRHVACTSAQGSTARSRGLRGRGPFLIDAVVDPSGYASCSQRRGAPDDDLLPSSQGGRASWPTRTSRTRWSRPPSCTCSTRSGRASPRTRVGLRPPAGRSRPRAAGLRA